MRKKYPGHAYLLNAIWIIALLMAGGGVSQAQSWVYEGGPGLSPGDAMLPNMIKDANGTLFVAYGDNSYHGTIKVLKDSSGTWVPVGDPNGATAFFSSYPSLAVDADNKLYMAYSDGANSNRVTLVQFDGTNWVPVGTPGFTPGATFGVSLDFDAGNTPYVLFNDNTYSYRASVMSYSAGAWSMVGTPGLSVGLADRNKLVVDRVNGIPYVVFRDNGTSMVVMQRYTGGAWSNVGDLSELATGPTDVCTMATDATGAPYVFFVDANYAKTYVRKYDGTHWQQLGGAVSDNWVYNPSMTITPSGEVYAAFTEYGFGGNVSASKFDGTNWSYIGRRGFAERGILFTSIVVDNSGVPFVSFRDDAYETKLTVMRYSATGAPYRIKGNTTVCMGSTAQLTSATQGGVWSSASSSIATINVTGVVTGVSAGKAVINYACSGGTVTTTVTVTGLPSLLAPVACAGSVMRVAAPSNPNEIVWQQNGGAVATVSGIAGVRVAGSGVWGAGADQLASPMGTFVDHSGNVYIADQYNHRVQKWAPGATTGVTVAGITGSAGNAADQLNNPNDVVVDAAGNVYALDYYNHRVQKWAPGATSGVTVAGDGTQGNAANQLNYPQDMAIDAAGNLYIADGNSRVQKWAPGATVGVTVAGNGTPGYSLSQVYNAYGVFVDGSNNLYVTDVMAGRVTKWAPGATAGIVVAGGSSGNEEDQIGHASSVVLDAAGNIYIYDQGNYRVQKWAPGATSGVTFKSDVYGVLSIDDTGNIYVSEQWGNIIKLRTIIDTTYIPSAGGNYTAVVTTQGCIATTNAVTINEGPHMTTSPDADICPGSSTSLTVSGANSYSWSPASGLSATTGGSVTATPNMARVYSVTGVNVCGSETKAISVNFLPVPPISGPTSIAIGSTTTLSIAATGGVWSSSAPAVASIDAVSGVVVAGVVGTTVINYNAAGSCTSTFTLTVNSLTVCVGQTTTLPAGSGGGTWTSSNGSVATVVASTGVVTGAGQGKAVMTYMSSGPVVTYTVTVNSLSPTLGVSSVCQGQSIPMTNATPAGGVWSSDNNTVATVNITGNVYGASGGVATISFTSALGCVATKTVNVTGVPGISSAADVCLGQTTTLSSDGGSGTWTSTNGSIATVSLSGTVGGVGLGSVKMNYAMTGCFISTTVTVKNLLPVTGTSTVCQGQATALSNATPGGGNWASGSTSVAIVNSTGAVNGLAAGTVPIYFTANNGCIATRSVTVNATPIISSSLSACVGQATPMSSTTTGGIWSSSNNSIATVTGTGVVYGVVSGTSRISYAVSGCAGSVSVSVGALSAITGGAAVCQGQTTALTNPTLGGGAWSSNNTTIATVTSTGAVWGVNGGAATISFTAVNSCVATKTVTINGTGAIAGTMSVCVGQVTNLSNNLTGGNWSTSSGALATVNTATGAVWGVSQGSPKVFYIWPSGCQVTATVTVSALSATTGGTGSMCASGSMTLANATPGGGVWSSSNTSRATVSAAGLVKGVGAGSVLILYTTTIGSCVATRTVTVNACREAGEDNGGDLSQVQEVSEAIGDVALFPNPNTGVFTLKGAIAGHDAVDIVVLNMLGQVVYRGGATVEHGNIDKQIELQNGLARGTYLLTLSLGSERKVFHFIVQ